MRCARCKKEVMGEDIKICPYCKSKLGFWQDVPIMIESLEIKKLFNRIDYKIDFKNDDNVSIFIAPNGCGKTTIFKFLNFILNPTWDNYIDIVSIPVENFACKLSNGVSLIYQRNSKKPEENHERNMNYSYIVKKGGKSEKINFYEEYKTINFSNYLSSVNREDFEENGKFNKEMFSEFLNEKVDKLFDNHKKIILKMSMLNRKHNVAPCISFINANRINQISLKDRNVKIDPKVKDAEQYMTTIDKCVEDSKTLVQQCNNEYTTYLDNAREELAVDYVNSSEFKLPYEKFMEEWNKYCNEIESYKQMGFLNTKNKVFDLKISKEDYENSKGGFLTLYLNKFSRTLAPFRELFHKVKLFTEIINDRNKFTGKSISFSNEHGIEMKVGGEFLDMNNLSSGEKNDFLMFYNLILGSTQNGIIFIDEPEISLHIEWQETFIDKILEISKINNQQVIIATHSPNIINGHFELFAKKEADYGI